MTTDILELDKNYNSIITEEKINFLAEHPIYKKADRYKHNDIIFLPEQNIIEQEKTKLPALPNRFKNITGTNTFKILKDFVLTFNLLNQQFAPHSENKSLIALDSRYIIKALGNRFHHNSNKFFSEFFSLELKGKKGKYTSGYSLTPTAINSYGKYNKVIHKDKLDDILISVINGDYNEKEIVNINGIDKENILDFIHNSYINIPKENIELLEDFPEYTQYITAIKRNYKEGKLYYTKDYKPYGRNYSYLHQIPSALRTALFNGKTEIDINSAAQSILYRYCINKTDSDLPNIKKYIDNKTEIREKLAKDLSINIKEAKKLIQTVTFLPYKPSKSQISFFSTFKKYEKALENEIIIGLFEDYKIIDDVIAKHISKEQIKIIKDYKGSVSVVDKRVYFFQSIESKIMEEISSKTNNNFHLHDAVYFDEPTEEELDKIDKVFKKYEINYTNNILVYKKYTNKIIKEFLNSDIKIKSEDKLKQYIVFCITYNEMGYIEGKEVNHHHILPKAKSCFPEYENLKLHSWNGTFLNKENHIKAHTLINEAIYNESMIYTEDMMKKIAKMNFKDISWLRKNQPKNTVIIEDGVNKCIPIEEYNKETMTHVNKNKVTVKRGKGFIQVNKEDLKGDEAYARSEMTNIIIEGKSVVIPLEEYDKVKHTHNNKGKSILFDNKENKWVSVDLSTEKDKSRYTNPLSNSTLVKTEDGLKRVSLQEYEEGDFDHFRKGMVAAKGVGLVSKEEYNKGNYKTASSDKVFVIFEDGSKGSVSSEEYAKNSHKYRQLSKVLFKIWNNEGVLIYEGYGRDELIDFCKQNNIPVSPIIVSYTNGGEPLNLIKRYAKFNGFVCKKIKS